MKLTRGEKIKRVLESKNISVQELAELTGRNKSYLYAVLRGAENPSLKTLEKIAEALGVSMSYLLDDEDTTDRIYYDEPAIYNNLPNDLQDFVVKEENTPYIRYAKMLTRYDIEELLKNIDDGDMKFLLTGLQMAIEQQKQLKNDK